MSCFGIQKTAQIPLQLMQIWYYLQMMHIFWPRLYGIESLGIFYTLLNSSIYTPPQKKCNFPRCISFETECKYLMLPRTCKIDLGKTGNRLYSRDRKMVHCMGERRHFSHFSHIKWSGVSKDPGFYRY